MLLSLPRIDLMMSGRRCETSITLAMGAVRGTDAPMKEKARAQIGLPTPASALLQTEQFWTLGVGNVAQRCGGGAGGMVIHHIIALPQAPLEPVMALSGSLTQCIMVPAILDMPSPCRYATGYLSCLMWSPSFGRMNWSFVTLPLT